MNWVYRPRGVLQTRSYEEGNRREPVGFKRVVLDFRGGRATSDQSFTLALDTIPVAMEQ